ncbi:MAG: response regulator [Planctomycetota bacterium]
MTRRSFARPRPPALRRRGFEVTEAESGAEALEAIRRNPPDVVLLDLLMPGMSGIDTLRKLRDTEPTLPVIILTGHGTFSDVFAGIRRQRAPLPVPPGLAPVTLSPYNDHAPIAPLHARRPRPRPTSPTATVRSRRWPCTRLDSFSSRYSLPASP